MYIYSYIEIIFKSIYFQRLFCTLRLDLVKDTFKYSKLFRFDKNN